MTGPDQPSPDSPGSLADSAGPSPGPGGIGAPRDPAAPPRARLAGSVVRITYQNPDNGYCVLRLDAEGEIDRRALTKDGLVTAVGVLPGVEVGQSIQAEGEWVRDPKFGPQFKVEWYKPVLPKGERGIEVYLGSGAVRGVGPVTARRIVQAFGEATFDVLDRQPERLREVLKGKTLKTVQAGWRAARGDRELVTFLGEHGVSPAIAARLRKTYGENALAIVRTNPYRLTGEVRGIGFLRADQIAQKIGLAADAPERIDAALSHVLERQAEEGHTCVPRARLEVLSHELLKVEPDKIVERLEEMIARERVVPLEIEGEPVIFMRTLYEAERRIEARLRRLLASPKSLPRIDAIETLADFEQRSRLNLAAAQREAALALARHGMLILTGGPGTGKTTTVRAVIELFRRGPQIKLAAPTGRAARRLTETAGLPAETVHRLLNFQAPLGRFGRDASNPIEADLVIVDEVSMLDVPLAASLFEALAPRTCLLLVGDEDQLPSVGPGNVLGDLIASGVMPVVRLGEVFRQAGESLIVTNAHRINRGLMPYLKPPEPEAAARGAKTKEPDFFFIERQDPAQVIDTIKVLIRERIPRKFHLDPHNQVQVLTPMRRGDLGVEAINQELKTLLNPGAARRRAAAVDAPGSPQEQSPPEIFGGSGGENQSRGMAFNAGDRSIAGPGTPGRGMAFDAGDRSIAGPGTPGRGMAFDAGDRSIAGSGTPGRGMAFDAGDRVMQISNNYDKFVYNGDIGTIISVNAETREAVVQFEGREVNYLHDELDQLTLAYAITIHKSQGSEYPAVIIPIHTQHWIMLQRNLIYTAITRARRLVCLVGTRQALARAVKNAERARRYTGLRSFLAPAGGAPPSHDAESPI